MDKYMCDFEAFWSAYPRKERKKDAKVKYEKRATDEEAEKAIMDGLAAWWLTDQWAVKKIFPHAATWLNQERWKDELSSSGSNGEVFYD